MLPVPHLLNVFLAILLHMFLRLLDKKYFLAGQPVQTPLNVKLPLHCALHQLLLMLMRHAWGRGVCSSSVFDLSHMHDSILTR